MYEIKGSVGHKVIRPLTKSFSFPIMLLCLSLEGKGTLLLDVKLP
jgi:hypothetical protein